MDNKQKNPVALHSCLMPRSFHSSFCIQIYVLLVSLLLFKTSLGGNDSCIVGLGGAASCPAHCIHGSLFHAHRCSRWCRCHKLYLVWFLSPSSGVTVVDVTSSITSLLGHVLLTGLSPFLFSVSDPMKFTGVAASWTALVFCTAYLKSKRKIGTTKKSPLLFTRRCQP